MTSNGGGMDVDSEPQAAGGPAVAAAAGAKRRGRDGGKDDDDDDDDEAKGPQKDEDVEMLDVNFSFFDPQPQDYHSIKLLLSQLVGHTDAIELDLGGVTDLVLEQRLVGSTVKTDSGEDDDKANEGDPYAVLTVLNLNVHKDKPAVSSLVTYLLSKLEPASPFHSQLTELLQAPSDGSSPAAPKHVGLVLSERMVNMPTQIVPPMYRMLQEELQWATEEKEPYNFSHLLFLSRVFLSSTASLEDDPNAALEQAIVAEAGLRAQVPPKKKKQRKGATKDERDEEKVWMYHPEDEFIRKFATHSQVYKYTRTRRQGQEGKSDDFGVEQRGQLMLLPWHKFADVVQGIEEFVGPAVA
ncbi:Mss4p nuclear export [Rhodotorula sphaerocarpa]